MGKKGTTVTPGVFKKMAGRAETKTGPLKRTSAPLKKQNKSSYGGYNK